jgi:nuclear pore complex protein Nup93
MSSLFGGGAQQSSGGGGLFGNSQTPASQTSRPSLFGQTAQPASSNLFGGSLGASTAASQPQSTGLFGPKPTTGGGIFGMGASASQPGQQSTSGMFPTLGQSISQPGQQQQGQQQQGQTQPEGSQLGQSKGPGSLQAAYFDQILERGKKRNSQDNGGGLGDLPSLQLGLGDIARKVRNLGNGGPSAEHAKAGDSRA